MKRTIPLLLLVCATAFADDAKPTKSLETDVRTLAAPNMEGRGLGTKGIGLATNYIEGRLRAIGLEPAFGKSYRQQFPVKMGVSLGSGNKLEGVADTDWTPLGFSSAGAFSGPLVFAGYGINAEPLGYNDFDGVDVKGKVVLMLRYEPQEKDDTSKFDGRKPSRWSAMRYKVLQARERGAVAVIFSTGPLQDEGKDKVPPLVNDGPESPAGIPVLQVKTSVAQRWAGDLMAWQKQVDADLKPRSRLLDVRVSGVADVKPQFENGENVAGVLPGRGALSEQVVVIGAHYDHLGYGGQGSMRPNEHAIHPGADDNASGDAAVMAIAERLKNQLDDVNNRRTVVVALFSGEEVGLAGSSWLVDHSPFVSRAVAMINLDMVGMMRDNKLIVFGSDSAPQWKEVVTAATDFSKLNVTSSGDGYGPSDQTSFYAKQIPVLHLFTGAHDRYHTPDDIASSLNYAGMDKVIDFGTSVMMHLAAGKVTPQYARAASAPAMEGDSRGYGAYLGTVPDYSAMDATTGGVLLADVRPGSPADKAGIHGKDRIVSIGGTRIENLYDMSYALQDHKPGDTVDIIVVRGDARLTLRATLTTRGVAPVAPVVAPPPSAAATPNRRLTARPVAPTPSPRPAKRVGLEPSPVDPSPSPRAPANAGAASPPASGKPASGVPALHSFSIGAGKSVEKVFEGEKHLKNIRQLTFGGENAEAYFSPDGTTIIYQATVPGASCDQEYTMDLATGETKLVSSGKGRTTCGYYSYPKGDRIVYATTEGGAAECPPKPDMSKGYVWPVYSSFDIVEANVDGSNAKKITTTSGYDAEMTWCHKGGKRVFTSMRDGDLDLYEMDDAGNVKRLTNTPGYDGGAFYNGDCTEIVWRANHPVGTALDEDRALLASGLVKPLRMELFLMNADGTNQRQITHNGAANFCPYFMNDGKRLIFASNVNAKGFDFDLWTIGKDGQGLERITTAPGFDGFCVFSPDGQYLIWASSRAKPDSHEMNLFIAKWVE